MADYGDCTVMSVTDPDGSQWAVVEQADDVIGISYELLDEVAATTVPRMGGYMALDGDYLEFGTEGRGLGRLKYQIVERRAHVAVARRRG